MLVAKLHRKQIFSSDGDALMREVLAICDSELLGRVFEGKDSILDLKKYRFFYDGEKISEEKAAELLKRAESINLVGKKSLLVAKKALGIDGKNAKKIKGIPHLQIYHA